MYHAPERDSGQSLAISEVVGDANGRGNGAFLTDPIRIALDGTVGSSRVEAEQSDTVIYQQDAEEHGIDGLISEVSTGLHILSFDLLDGDG
ncbi:MAG: hypothetical protein ACOCXA_03765 [Planctomycetota bacterium]